MSNRTHPVNTAKWPLVLLSAILIIAFFIPWVAWEKEKVTGAHMPMGHFFELSEKSFGLANPFPATSSAMVLLWLIPAFAAIALVLTALKKRSSGPALIAALLALSLTTAYVLFSNILSDLGVNYTLQAGIYISFVAAAGIILILTRPWWAKLIWVLIPPVLTYIGFYASTKYIENQEFAKTENAASDYTLNALEMIREFHANDSAANAKYREKIITVNGDISTLETPNDSTVNIKFVDTTGSYAIFTFHEQDAEAAKKLKEGESVSVKGSCSGGVLSEILGIESISFKRCAIIN